MRRASRRAEWSSTTRTCTAMTGFLSGETPGIRLPGRTGCTVSRRPGPLQKVRRKAQTLGLLDGGEKGADLGPKRFGHRPGAPRLAAVAAQTDAVPAGAGEHDIVQFRLVAANLTRAHRSSLSVGSTSVWATFRMRPMPPRHSVLGSRPPVRQ